MTTDDPLLVLAGDSLATRRALGPTAWLVLEELALRAAARPDGCLAAEISIRRLAADLGLAKDTVASAVGRLTSVGVARFDADRQRDGRFGRGSYILDLRATGLALADGQPRPKRPDAATDAARRRRSSVARRNDTASQLDLFTDHQHNNDRDDNDNCNDENHHHHDHKSVTQPTNTDNDHHPNQAQTAKRPKPTDALAPGVRPRPGNVPVNGGGGPC